MNRHFEKRPWGNFEQFCANEACTVKILNVDPNSKLSLQYHNYRDEFWKIVSGKGKVIIGEKMLDCKEGDEFFVPKMAKHRIVTDESFLKILEIDFGEFSEDDIVRVEDIYNRV